VVVVVDDDSQQAECDESNNTATLLGVNCEPVIP
jgi:hypothetical protein